MGRMADARKRAKQKGGGGGDEPKPPAPESAAPPAPPPERERPPQAEPSEPPEDPILSERRSYGAPRWVSSEETLTFPTDAAHGEARSEEDSDAFARTAPSAAGHGRIALPSSGLASDILAREDTRSVELPVPSREPEPAPLPVPATPRSQSSVALFGPQTRDDRRAAPEQMEHLVTFYLSDEEYGLDVRTVQEIIRVTDTTHVPRAPEFIKGVINLRGRIIPVVDLKKKLELGEVAESRLARIVVVKLRERLIGLLVDGASQVLKIPASSIDQAPEEILDVNVTFIRGVAKLEKRLIILLDLYKILAMEIDHAATS